MKIKKIIIYAVFISCFAFLLTEGTAQVRIRFGGMSIGQAPQPRLIRPVVEVVDLRGKKELAFEWSTHEQPVSGRSCYQFKVYKGYQMYVTDLIIKKELSRGANEIKINADNFHNGETYTWALRQRSNDFQWSDYGYHSFKVVK